MPKHPTSSRPTLIPPLVSGSSCSKPCSVQDVRADRGYVICSEHRSGSTLLCRMLSLTGRLGYPDEIFRSPAFCAQVERDPAILNGLIEKASTDNGIYGLKLFSQQFDITSKARWTQRLPNLHYIHLERDDLLGQAISLVRALQTDQYFASQTPRAEPRYDARAIARHLARIAEGQTRWRLFFARNGITPLRLRYEQLVADPQATVDRIAALVGVASPRHLDLATTGTAVQRDAISESWRERFVAESRDLSYLDNRFGRPRVWLRRLARDVGTRVRRA